MNNKDENLINKIVYLMATDNSTDASADSVKWAKNIFRPLNVQSKKSIIQKVLAVLQMDLSPNKAAFGERSASAAKSRQMLFQAGDSAVDLRISRNERDLALHGQILGEGFADCTVKLGNFVTMANKLSEFSFLNIPIGEYDLTVQSSEMEITIEDLEIK
jgi:hypothetical protein